jgi:hypothetical protein
MHCRDVKTGQNVEAHRLESGAVLILQPIPRIASAPSFDHWYTMLPEQRQADRRQHHERRRPRMRLSNDQRREIRRVGDRMTVEQETDLAVHLNQRGHAR